MEAFEFTENTLNIEEILVSRAMKHIWNDKNKPKIYIFATKWI